MIADRTRRRDFLDDRGFVLPVVILGLVLLSLTAVAAVLMSDDEQRSARAVRESASAFYAAEAGFHQLWANWPDSAVSALAAGDSLDLGWQMLGHGAQYRGRVRRYDAGGQAMFGLTIEGRGPGGRSGQRVLSFTITAESGGPGGAGTLPPWGRTGAVTGRGGWAASGNMAGIDGHDHVPSGGSLFGSWDWNDYCPTDSLYDAPGVTWDDKSKVETGNGGQIKGVPPIVEDPDLVNDDNYWAFGDLTWDDLVAMADYTIEDTGDNGFGMGPKTSGGECVTPWSGAGWGATNYNFGSPDPNNACFNYFPIAHLKGKNTITAMSGQGVGQGILLVDGKLQFGQGAKFYGLMIVRGCIEAGNAGHIYGAVLIDNTAGASGCGGGGFMIGNASESKWSSCVVRRTLENAGADFGLGDEGDKFTLLGSRSFGELLR